MSNILFLDFDGVVNTPLLDAKSQSWKMNFPSDGCVNNKEAVALISKFCKAFDFNIVVTSDWRLDRANTWRQCLHNSGLDSSVQIVGNTPNLWCTSLEFGRGHEIKQWLSEHPEVKNFIIIDDDVTEMLDEQRPLYCCH